MSFSRSIPIPANTLKSSPVEIEVILPEQRYSEISVFFPPGCKGNVGIQVRHHGQLFAPYASSSWCVQDAADYTVATSVVLQPPYIIVVTAYNEGTSTHNLVVKATK